MSSSAKTIKIWVKCHICHQVFSIPKWQYEESHQKRKGIWEHVTCPPDKKNA